MGAVVNLMSEVWVPVADSTLFEVSSIGRVRRVSGDLVQQKLSEQGMYPTCPLGRVHLVVLTSFHGPGFEGAQSRHLDGCSTKNRTDNLAWGTVQQNHEDKQRHGTTGWSDIHCRRGHAFERANLAMRGPTDAKFVCLACRRAKLFIFNRAMVGDITDYSLQMVSDRMFAKIMKETYQYRRAEEIERSRLAVQPVGLRRRISLPTRSVS